MSFLKKKLQGSVNYHSSLITEGIILNANENPYETPKELINHLNDYVNRMDIARYPDTDSTTLVEGIAKLYNVKAECVTCGVGSDELLDCLLRSVIDDEYVLICNPSFSMYTEFVKMTNGKTAFVDFNEDFSFNVDNILKKIDEYNPKVIFICSPNNPTGSVIDNDSLRKIAAKTKGILAIDEAYVEFSDMGDALELINEFDNVLVFRTFSKAYGLAGMRCGYAIGPKELIDAINVTKAPYNLSRFTIEGCTFAINNSNLFKENISKIKASRTKLYNELLSLGIEVSKSNANFLWMKLDEKIVKHLDEKKIYIRKMKYKETPFFRITIGTEEENSILIKAIKEVI